MIKCCKYGIPVFFRWAGIFHIETNEQALFLTFDDGPSTETTFFILKSLDRAKAKATFFCSGKQVKEYPELFAEIKRQNHKIGNHGYNHLNGIKSPNSNYFEDIEKADKLIQSKIFRPPYGKLKPSQYFNLRKKFQIIFWTVMSQDFDMTTSWQADFKKIIPYLKKGCIIVFHDTGKAKKKLEKLLPAILTYGIEKGFVFKSLPI